MSNKNDKKSKGRTAPFERTIYGQPYSKANSRRLVTHNGRPVFIKSKEAMRYLEDFHRQCPHLDPLFEDEVHARITIYYKSNRPDLDESLVLDAMQGRIYRNDRQVRKKTIEWGLDKENPRAEIRIELLSAPK